MIEIRRITTDDPLYQQECDLRERALLRVVGLDMAIFNREFPGVDEQAEHFVAVFDHPRGERVVGCALLRPGHPAPGTGQLMQMATDPQRQGEGIGRMLVAALERRAFGEIGLTEIFCHARDHAIGFYDRLGWKIDSDEFLEVGIKHKRMVLRESVPGGPGA